MIQRHISHPEGQVLFGLARLNPPLDKNARFGPAEALRKLHCLVRPQLPPLDSQVVPVCPIGRDSCEIAIGCSINNQEQLGSHMGDTQLGHRAVDKLGARPVYTSPPWLRSPGVWAALTAKGGTDGRR